LLVVAAVAAVIILSGGGKRDDSSPDQVAANTTRAEASGEDITETSVAETEQSPSSEPTASPQLGRAAAVTVLQGYEEAYSNADLAAMGSLLTADVVRHGLKAGGCSTDTGKQAVLSAYRSQFTQDGPVGYELVGLGAGEVELVGGSEAQVDTEYSIAAANNSGSISFVLLDRGGNWKIREIDATCNPQSS
jgi:SnoaL-like protein